jgi:hypothetical protein
VERTRTGRRLTGENAWLELAKEVAEEATRVLWRGKLFVGHPTKRHYMNTDHVGLLCYALLQLEDALGKDIKGRTISTSHLS